MTKRKTHEQYERELTDIDIRARAEGPQMKKTWSRHDLRSLKAATERQSDALRAWFEGCHVGLLGSAGTGKTLLACYMAANSMLTDEGIDKIIIVRSAVQGRDMGHLPGTNEEKMSVYEKPYVQCFQKLFGRPRTFDDMKAAGKVYFESTSFNRGVTWDNAVVILDEVQNMTWEEINTAATRLGECSRLIVIGDTKQIDLSERYHEISGIEAMSAVVREIEDFETVHFTKHDVVRSGFVRSWIIACEDYFDRTPRPGQQLAA
jgi:phosphate starvation-inducible PhoH-like protein